MTARSSLQEPPCLVLTRIYPVAAEKVWRAWTDPKALARWFGPADADTAEVIELELRVGGRYRIVFGAPDGSEHEASGVYTEVEPPRRLSFTWSRRGLPEAESQVTIALRPVDGGTELSFRHVFGNVAARDDHQIGWLPTFAKLDALLAGTLA
jgi:uncharacterized protein YndB with AHSA1/START domain